MKISFKTSRFEINIVNLCNYANLRIFWKLKMKEDHYNMTNQHFIISFISKFMHLLKFWKINFKISHSESDMLNLINFANLKQLLRFKRCKSIKND